MSAFSDEITPQLDELVVQLGRTAEQLRSGEVSADHAASLVEEAAALAARAASELERQARALTVPAQLPGQDALL